MLFRSVAGVDVGSIDVSNVATTYNTTSDARLKFDVTPLAGALDVIRALNPVSLSCGRRTARQGGVYSRGEVQEVIPMA